MKASAVWVPEISVSTCQSAVALSGFGTAFRHACFHQRGGPCLNTSPARMEMVAPLPTDAVWFRNDWSTGCPAVAGLSLLLLLSLLTLVLVPAGNSAFGRPSCREFPSYLIAAVRIGCCLACNLQWAAAQMVGSTSWRRVTSAILDQLGVIELAN